MFLITSTYFIDWQWLDVPIFTFKLSIKFNGIFGFYQGGT